MSDNRNYTPRHLQGEPARRTGQGRSVTGASAQRVPPGRVRRPASAARAQGRRSSAPGSRSAAQTSELPPRSSENIGAGSVLFKESLLPTVEHVHRIDQKALRIGVYWLFILPVLLLIIRRMTDSNRVAFLIVWIIGMFVISAVLIFIGYADHELKRFLKDSQRFVPDSEAELDSLMAELNVIDPESLPISLEVLRSRLAHFRESPEADARLRDEAADNGTLRKIEERFRTLEERRRKEARVGKHSGNRSR